MLLTTLLLSALPLPQVDLVLGPPVKHAPIGGFVTVDLVARAAQPPTVEMFSGVDAILSWDPAALKFIEADASAFPWFISGFLPDPDGINVDVGDGEALFTALSSLTTPASVPGDLLVATFKFKVLDRTILSLSATSGSFGKTRVLGTMPGEEITGDISATVKIRGRVKIVSNPTPATGTIQLARLPGRSTATAPGVRSVLLSTRASATGRVATVEYSSAGSLVVTNSGDGWSTGPRPLVLPAFAVRSRPVAVALDPIGRYLAVTFATGSTLYDAWSLEPIVHLPGHRVTRPDPRSVWENYATFGAPPLVPIAAW